MNRHARRHEQKRTFRILMHSVVGIGVACLGFAFWHAWQVHKCRSWPRTDAVVSRLSLSYSTNLPGHNKRTPIHITERIDFRYSYEVNGKKFESSRFFFLPGYPRAFELRERYPEGKRFMAYYHPRNPSVAIVEPESVSYPAFWIGLTLVTIRGLAFLSKQRQGRVTPANERVG